jgi:hypothetical protein
VVVHSEIMGFNYNSQVVISAIVTRNLFGLKCTHLRLCFPFFLISPSYFNKDGVQDFEAGSSLHYQNGVWCLVEPVF